MACFLACDIKKLTKFAYDDVCDVFGGSFNFNRVLKKICLYLLMFIFKKVHGTGGVVTNFE